MSEAASEAFEAAAQTPAPQTEAPAEGNEPQEVHESIVRVATAMGWVPREQFRKGKGWVDAETFLAQQPARLKSLTERISTIGETTDRILRDNSRQIEARIRAEMAAAVEAGDTERAQDAAERLAEVRTPRQDPRDVQREFSSRNPWFGTHRAATAVAREAAGELAAQGISDPARQLKAAEDAVREEFPDLFDEAHEDRPSRPSPSKAAPSTMGGQRTASTAPREKGWADLPADVRNTMTDKRLAAFGYPPGEEGKKRYAKSYFETKKEASR